MKAKELSAKQLIAKRLKEQEVEDIPAEEMYYVCLDTGLTFDTHGEPAEFSPFTGSRNLEPIEGLGEEEQQADTPIPSNQADPFSQNPLMPSPTGELAGFDWLMTQQSDNPSPDIQALIGDDDADANGFVSYKPTSVPPYKEKKAGERTDQAPAGSK